MVEMITYDPEIFNETWDKISNVTEKRMKQYKLNTHLISGYRKDEEIPKEVKDDLISEGCPESWFSPVEEEVKEGQYRYCKTNQDAYRINKKVADNKYEILWICEYSSSNNCEIVKEYALKEDKVLDTDSISEHLIAEAKRRGLVHGTKINNSSVVGFEVKDKDIEDYRYLKYNKNSDSLSYVSDNSPKKYSIYEQGTWASIVDEPIQINGYEVTFQDDKDFPVKVGCSNLNIRLFTALRTCIDKFDCSIYREGEDITKQIKQIAKRL